ncbi:MAG TPA: AbrB/MazE/SpoVT family DNA-binding domain-containing protein [Allosphingosinicella sp.]|jgi:antitoxin VapB
MGAERHVKLFRNGRNQAVRIPREFELPGEDAVIRKEGDRLVIEPRDRKGTIAELLDRWAAEPAVDEEWEEPDDSPPDPLEI